MTPDEFKSISFAVLGTTLGWEAKIAAQLGKDPKVIRGWLTKEISIPDDIAAKLEELKGKADPHSSPDYEWLVGESVNSNWTRREYIYHMQTPRFTARILTYDFEGKPRFTEKPKGKVYPVNKVVALCDVNWIDEPESDEAEGLISAAVHYIDLVQAFDYVGL
ncbi:hypothetical protein [Flexibacterium corallicola]|uniref:hypothetical protein n=1 Tax=Flexibacterium corallicola TaxID=3037259 RepID=UPI00286F20C6|nr:hypothetical protein [Pseudovibrio sp. M1P-2-3]